MAHNHFIHVRGEGGDAFPLIADLGHPLGGRRQHR